MDLSRLKGSTLKLYLTLVARADGQRRCLDSLRTLSQRAELARNTTARALHQLEQCQLIAPWGKGWEINTTPLAHLVQFPSGSKIEPPAIATGLKIEPVGQKSGSKNKPNCRSSNARTRTLWSSSSEEDKELVLPPSSPRPELVGEIELTKEEEEGREDQNGFIAKMKRLWDRVDSYGRAYPEDWFAQLKDEFGANTPPMVLEQFIQSGRTLADLKQPGSYQRYFATCCRNAPPPAPDPYDDAAYEGDLEALYLADHEKLQAQFAQEANEFRREDGASS